MHLNPEAFTMYHKHRDLNQLLSGKSNLGKNQKKVLGLLQKFKTIKPEELTYRVHRRSVRSLQNIPNGAKLLVKDLDIIKVESIAYPDDCLTEKQRKDYRKLMNLKR